MKATSNVGTTQFDCGVLPHTLPQRPQTAWPRKVTQTIEGIATASVALLVFVDAAQERQVVWRADKPLSEAEVALWSEK